MMQSAYGPRTDNGGDRIYYGCFMSGGNGNLLGAQLVEVVWIAGMCSKIEILRLAWMCQHSGRQVVLLQVLLRAAKHVGLMHEERQPCRSR